MSDDERLKDDVIELRTKRVLEMEFEKKNLEQYWCLAMDLFEKKHYVCSLHSRRFIYENLDLVLFLSIKTKSRNR